MTADRHVRDELGALVLGALGADEADAVRRHLERCPACRAEHERLAVVGPLLDLVAEPAAGAPDVRVPHSVEAEVLRGFRAGRQAPTAARRRARWRPRLALPAAALAGAACALAVVALVSALWGERRELALRGPAGSAAAEVSAVPGGTRVRLRAESLAPTRRGAVYEVWLVREGGRVSAGTFTVGPDGGASVELTAAGAPGRYERLGVTREPDALDPARNGPSVLVADLGA